MDALVSVDQSADVEWLRGELVWLLNQAIDRQLKSKSKSVCTMVPLPDGSIVDADKATPEQWYAAQLWMTGTALNDAVKLLHPIVTLAVSRACYAAPANTGT